MADPIFPVLAPNPEWFARWLCENNKSSGQYAFVDNERSLRRFPRTRKVLVSRLSSGALRNRAEELGYTLEYLD